MRHLNGVYTQLMNKDGTLFRGRYRACLIEADNYLIQVGRNNTAYSFLLSLISPSL